MKKMNRTRVLLLVLFSALMQGICWACFSMRPVSLNNFFIRAAGGASLLVVAVLFGAVFFMVRNGRRIRFAEKSRSAGDPGGMERFNAGREKPVEVYTHGGVVRVKEIGKQELAALAEFREIWNRIKNS
jgi:hypothetical protein